MNLYFVTCKRIPLPHSGKWDAIVWTTKLTAILKLRNTLDSKWNSNVIYKHSWGMVFTHKVSWKGTLIINLKWTNVVVYLKTCLFVFVYLIRVFFIRCSGRFSQPSDYLMYVTSCTLASAVSGPDDTTTQINSYVSSICVHTFYQCITIAACSFFLKLLLNVKLTCRNYVLCCVPIRLFCKL